jgi:hypothetical protein
MYPTLFYNYLKIIVPFAEYKFSKKGMSFGDIVEGKH